MDRNVHKKSTEEAYSTKIKTVLGLNFNNFLFMFVSYQ